MQSPPFEAGAAITASLGSLGGHHSYHSSQHSQDVEHTPRFEVQQERGRDNDLAAMSNRQIHPEVRSNARNMKCFTLPTVAEKAGVTDKQGCTSCCIYLLDSISAINCLQK